MPANHHHETDEGERRRRRRVHGACWLTETGAAAAVGVCVRYTSVSEYLYDYRLTIAQRREEADRRVQADIKAKANSSFTKDLSRKLVVELKARAYEAIYR